MQGLALAIKFMNCHLISFTRYQILFHAVLYESLYDIAANLVASFMLMFPTDALSPQGMPAGCISDYFSLYRLQEWIMEQWEKNYYISAIAGANNGSSLIVMSKG